MTPNEFNYRHEGLHKKDVVWQLINQSYKGGEYYRAGGNLFQYPREETVSYGKRLQRAVYRNHVQPLADRISGFPFIQEVKRKYPKYLDEFAANTYRGVPLEEFSRMVSLSSLLYTCFVLVDSPKYDPELIRTEADRIEQGISPYCVLYDPFKIRNFKHNQRGKLIEITLDDSYKDNEGTEIKKYTKWTPEFTQSYTELKGEIIEGEKLVHNLGVIPGRLVLWKDIDKDCVQDSPFEDIAYMDRLIYGYGSLQDELIYSGTFQALFYPVAGAFGIPKELTTGDIGTLTAIPFNGELSQAPFFLGADISNVEKVELHIQSLIKDMLTKIGIKEDITGNQSGYAKSLDFTDLKSYITAGCNMLESFEEDILYFAALWFSQNPKEGEIDVTYEINFEDDDTTARIESLIKIFDTIPYETVKKQTAKEIVKESFKDLDKSEIAKIMKDIEKSKSLLGEIADLETDSIDDETNEKENDEKE